MRTIAWGQIARRDGSIARHDVHVFRAVEDEILTVQPRVERLDLSRRHPGCIVLGVALILRARGECNPFSTTRPSD